jgi:Mak10 subunit, NatC N(alpha)-terminal acetyltransferase
VLIAALAQIGEPRLDSGLIVQEELRPPFNPLTPLLPEELCWILDRSLGYEVCGSSFLMNDTDSSEIDRVSCRKLSGTYYPHVALRAPSKRY